MVPDAFTYVALLKAGQRSGKHSVADVDMVMKEMASRRMRVYFCVWGGDDVCMHSGCVIYIVCVS